MSLSQNYPTTRPTLTLDFAKAKRVDPRVTFTRASTATYFDASGVLQSAANNVPRIDFNPSTLLCNGLLIEEARTNNFTYSDDFADASWTKTRATITSNATSAPDDTTNGDHLVEDTTPAATHFISAISTSFVSGTAYTISFFAKSDGSGRRIQAGFPNTAFGSTTRVNFNVDTQTVTAGTNSTGSITSVGGGWYRCAATMTATATASTAIFFSLANADSASLTAATYNGDGTSGIFIWGAQLEAGAFATSYIPTTTTALTRSADVASVNTLSPWYNASAGTFFCEFNTAATTSGANLWETQQTSTSAERIEIGVSSAGVFNPRVVSGGAATVSLTVSTYSFGTTGKIAFAIRPTNYAASFNSATPITSSDADAPATQEILYLGCHNGNSVFLNGYIQRITYYNTRLPNAQLQALTAP